MNLTENLNSQEYETFIDNYEKITDIIKKRNTVGSLHLRIEIISTVVRNEMRKFRMYTVKLGLNDMEFVCTSDAVIAWDGASDVPILRQVERNF